MIKNFSGIERETGPSEPQEGLEAVQWAKKEEGRLTEEPKVGVSAGSDPLGLETHQSVLQLGPKGW